jgi:hypothetical protein
MVIFVVHLWKGGGVNDVVIRRIVKHLIHPLEGVGKDLSSLFILEGLHMLETGMMGLRKDPRLKWRSGGERGNRDERLIFIDDPASLLKLLADDIAEDTSVFITKIVFCPFDLLTHSLRDDGEGNDLGVWMFERGSSG